LAKEMVWPIRAVGVGDCRLKKYYILEKDIMYMMLNMYLYEEE